MVASNPSLIAHEASKIARAYGMVKYGFKGDKDVYWPPSPTRSQSE